MRGRRAVSRNGALGVAVLGVAGLGIAGLAGCSAASGPGAAAQAPAAAAASAAGTAAAAASGTAEAAGTANATAEAAPAGTAPRAPVDRYMPALLVVSGTFEESGGGPVSAGKTNPPVMPLAGVVTFGDSGGDAFSVTVGASGKFSVNLAPGSYTVTGRSKGSDTPCSSPLTLTVRPGTQAHVTVVCSVS